VGQASDALVDFFYGLWSSSLETKSNLKGEENVSMFLTNAL